MGASLTCCARLPDPPHSIAPSIELHNDVTIITPLFDATKRYLTKPQLSEHITIKLYERARYLASLNHASLGWQRIDGQRSYYFNCLTSKVALTLPDDAPIITLNDHHIKPSINCFPSLTELCISLDLTLEFASPDPYYRSLISCQLPSLCSALYSIPLIQRVIQSYPNSFWYDACIKRIVLCENLMFDNVSRDAVPVAHSHSLYISLKRQECVFYMSMIHHEIFHLIDAVFCQSTSSSSTTDSAHTCDYDDPEWRMSNVNGFQYGSGGDKLENRSSEMSISGIVDGKAIPNGFVSRYAMSDPAEDRAEIFGALMRNPVVLRDSTDMIIQQKCDIIRRRVQLVCKSFDSAWWSTIERVHSFSLVNDKDWVTMTDSHGRQFWYNNHTQQSAVIR